MRSKWTAAVAAMAAMALAVVGLSVARGDDHEELEKLMKDVNIQNNIIRKAVRTATEYKKSPENIQKAAEKLVELGKKGRDNKSAAEKEKKPQTQWADAMDKFVKASEKVAKAAKDRVELPAAKKAFAELTKSCSDCHTDFRKDGDDDFGK